MGGAATTLNIGATTGTASIKNANVTLPNALVGIGTNSPTSALFVTRPTNLAFTGKAVAIFDQNENQDIITASASGVTRFSVARNGDVTTTGDVNVNGGDIFTSTTGTATVFNTNATTLNIGGAATTVSIGAGSGSTTINNPLTASGTISANGGLNVATNQTLQALGQVTFTPSGTNGVTITSDSDSFLTLAGLQSSSGTALCVDGSNHVITCAASSQSLQSAYNNGNTISTSNNRDIAFTLSDTATDSNFTVTTAAGSTSTSKFVLADGANPTPPAQLILVDNADSDQALTSGIKVTASGGAGGGVTTALDVSDSSIVTAIDLGANDIAGTNFSVDGSTGDTTVAGTINANGGTIATSNSSASVFNSNATTLNIGGASTSLTLGATTGTTSIRNATLSLPNATTVNATGATGNFSQLTTGGGYASTGTSITNTGDISAKGNLTIDGTSQLTGALTASAGITVSGASSADLISSKTTANLFNTTATTLNIGGAATTVSLGNASGTTTVNGGLTVASGKTLLAQGQSTFTPSGTNGITINTDSDSFLSLTGLTSVTGSAICVDGSNHVGTCNAASQSLQAAYNNGNTILTSDNRDIAFTLSDTTTDSKFTVTTATGATGGSEFTRADGAGTADPSQLVLIKNNDTNRALPVGLKISGVTGGNVTTAIDLSDSNITTALSLGTGDVSGTHYSITGASGNISTDGNLTVKGGTIGTNQTSFDLLNATATTINFGGAASTLNIGATGGTATISNDALSLPNATGITASGAVLTVDSESLGGGYGSTGTTLSNTGDISANGNLTIDGTSQLTGAVTASGGITVSGASSADLISSKTTANLFNTTATTLNIGGAATTVSLGNASGTTTVNGNLTVGANKTLTSTGAVSFTPSGTNGVTITTDTDSFLTVPGLTTTVGVQPAVCIDGSNHIVKCDATANNSLQTAYNNGNTIATSNNRDIAFTLSDTATDSNFTVTTAAGSTSTSKFVLADGSNPTPAAQLVLIDNADANQPATAGLKVTSSGGGGVTTALDVSDAGITTGLALGGSAITGTNFNVASTGDITTAANIAVNGGFITTSGSTGSVFDTNATTVTVGNAATSYTLGATNATGNLRGTTINFPNATTISAGSAALNVLSTAIGGGYGSTGLSITNAGDLSTNGNITVDGTSQLTGAVTASAGITVSGASSADLISSKTTANLFNTTATTLNIGGAATTLSLGAAAGTTTVNGALTVASSKTLSALGPVSLDPNGANDVTITTDYTAGSYLVIPGLDTQAGSILCVDGSNNVVKCAASSQSLQTTYNAGNTIDTSDARDIAFALSDTSTDSKFSVTTADGSTGYSLFERANGTGAADPSQLILVNNGDTNRAIPIGIKVTSSGGGGVTTALDVSDAGITTGLALGASAISGTNFSVTSGGSITAAGDAAINNGNITTTSTGTATVFNTNATTLNMGGDATAYTLGATTATGNIRGTTINFPNATTITAGSADLNILSTSIGGGYGSTGVTITNAGNISADGDLVVGGTSTTTGLVTASTGIKVNGASQADITTDKTTATVFNSTATTLKLGEAATTVSIGAGGGTTTVNGALTVASGKTFTANGATSLTPSGSNGVTINTPSGSSSYLSLLGLTGGAGTSLCIDGSNHVVTCNAGSSAATLQSAYNTGNTINTSDNKDIAFTLSDTSTDSKFTVTAATNSTSDIEFLRADGAGTNDPSQLVLIKNNDVNRALPIGLKIAGVSGGNVTTALDVSDANVVTGLALGASAITGTNFGVATNGDITTAGDIAVNGGDVTTSNTTATVFNTNATTVNAFGDASTLIIGANNSGTATIRNSTLTFSGSALNATSATGAFSSLTTGGGYASTGTTISSAGVIQTKGALTVDGASTLTGLVTASAGVQINGATTSDLIAMKSTANIFNTVATTINLGDAATTALNLGNGTSAYSAINIGNGNITSGTNTITIGNGASGTGIEAITIGSSNSSSSLALNAGTGNMTLSSSGTLSFTGSGASSTTTFNIPSSLASAFDIKQAGNDYFNISTNGTPSLTFGNATTNPTYSFAGTGNVTITGDLIVNGGDVSATSGTSVNLFNTAQTTSLSVGGSADVAIGGSAKTVTVGGNLTVNGTTTALASTAINLTGNGVTLDQSGTGTLSINTTTNRDITIGSGTLTLNGNTINLAGSAPAIAATTTNAVLAIDSNGSGALNLQGTNATGNVNIAGGSGSTGCTITNSTGALVCAGSITSNASSGTVQQGFFTKDYNTKIISNTAGDDYFALATSGGANSLLSLSSSALTTSGVAAFNNAVTISGSAASSTYYGQKLALTNNQSTNADTVYGQYITFTDAGSLANAVTGLYVDASTANTADTTYAAVFRNTSGAAGVVGIGTSAPTADLDISSAQTTGNVLKITDTSITTGNFLTVSNKNANSVTPSTLTLNDRDFTVGGHTDFKAPAGNGTIVDVFVYDTTKDADGGNWTDSDAARSTSWYNETLDHAASTCVEGTDDRCGQRAFPRKAIIVATNSGSNGANVSIYDAKDNSLWMQFQKSGSTDGMIGTATSNTISSVFALNGKLYVGNNGGSAGGLYVIDFTRDTAYKYNATGNYSGTLPISSRNSANTWLAYTTTANNLIPSATINNVRAAYIHGKDYFAVATAGGGRGAAALFNYSTQTLIANFGANANSTHVALTPTGTLYYTITSGGNNAIKAKYNAISATGNNQLASVVYGDISTANYGVTTTDTNTFASLVFTAGPAPVDATFVPTGLTVVPSSSTVDGTSDTIYVPNGDNVTRIDTKYGDETNGMVKYYNANLITEDLIGDIRGYLPFNGTAGSIANNTAISGATLKGNSYIAKNPNGAGLAYGSGVRGTGLTGMVTDDYICTGSGSTCADDADFDTTTGNMTFGAWVKRSATGSLQTIMAKMGNANADRAFRLSMSSTDFPTLEVMNGTGTTRTATSGQAITDTSNWHYIVGVFDNSGGNQYLYVDGVQVATTTNTNDSANSGVAFTIGADLSGGSNAAADFWNGSIDEPFFTGEVLSATQIQHMYSVGLQALQNHTASRVTGVTGADTYQRLSGGGSVGVGVSTATSVAVDDSNTKLFMGTSDATTNTGGVSVISTASDSLIDLYSSVNTTKVDDGNNSIAANDVVAVSVAGSPTNGQVLAIGGTNDTTYKVWAESKDVSFQNFIASNYNPFGTTLVQQNLNVNGVLSLNNGGIVSTSTNFNIDLPTLSTFSITNSLGTILALTDTATTDTLSLGLAGSRNGAISFKSSGAGISAPTIAADSLGNLTVQTNQSGTNVTVGSGNGAINIVPTSNNNVFVSLGSGGATGDVLYQTNGTTFSTFTDTGRVGIGNFTPADFKFEVQDSQTATAAAMIWNTAANTTAGHTGLIVKLGTAGNNTNPNANDAFLKFLQGDGRRRGQVIGNGASGVTYQTGGADYAEYFAVNESLLPANYTEQDKAIVFSTATVICQTSSGVAPCGSDYDSTVMGVISSAPAFQGGEDGPNKVIVGLLGQLPVKVTTANGNINKGDPLTASSTTGVAMKASKAGTIIGYALESYSGGSIGQIQAYVSSNYADPTDALSHLSLGGSGQLLSDRDIQTSGQIIATSASIGNASQFTVDQYGNTTTGNLFANGNITSTGTVSAVMVALGNGTISSDNNGGLVSQLAVDLNGNNNPTKFAFKNAAGMEVMGIDSNGNATIAGTLTTNIGNYDLAEDYPTKDTTIEAGDIVAIDGDNDTHITKSQKAYDSTVIGIYSEKPGFRLSQIGTIGGDRAVPVALNGRVPVKVNNENGSIRKGDYLTTSSVPGVAMKATKPGQVVGKALQDFTGTTGKITAFVNISFADPGNFIANLTSGDKTLASNVVSSDSIKLPQNLAINGNVINGSLSDGLLALSQGITNTQSGIDRVSQAIVEANAKTDAIALKIASLEERNASNSAAIAKALENGEALDAKVSSTSSELENVNARIEAILARLNAQTSTQSSTISVATSSASIASGSASPSYLAVTGENVSSPDSLISQSVPSIDFSTRSTATLPAGDTDTLVVRDGLKSLGSTYLGNTTVTGAVTVAGQAYLSDTDVVGKFSVNNTITISENAVNVLGESTSKDEITGGILYLQNAPEAVGLDIFSGKITIDKNGNITTQGSVNVKGDINVEGAITITATAGEEIKAHDALYISSENTVKRADATFKDRSTVIGIAASDTKKGSTVTIIIGGKVKGFKNLQAGKKYYLQTNAGITPTPPAGNSLTVPVGIAFSKEELLIQLSSTEDKTIQSN